MERDIDEELVQAVKALPPSLEKIQQLVANGADVNALDAGKQLPVLFHAVQNKLISTDVLEFLIRQGVDLQYRTGIVFVAAVIFQIEVGRRPEIVICLLKNGANPNSIHGNQAALDWTEWLIRCSEPDEDGTFTDEDEPMMLECGKAIRQILRDAGGKLRSEIVAKTIGTYLEVAHWGTMGLFSDTGNLAVELLPDVSADFCARFRKWHQSICGLTKTDDMKLFTEKNREGRSLAREIQKLVGTNIKVGYHDRIPPNFLLTND